MKIVRSACAAAVALSAGWPLSSAIADETSDKVKALTNAKAILDAETARDVAEAARIKAAADLANAKSASEKATFEAKVARDNAEASAVKAAADLAIAKALAANTDKATFDAMTARDAAQATAVKAAADLAKAKAAAGNVDTEIAKAQADADTALTTAKVAAQAAEITALKTAFGTAPTIGTDGNVTISESTTGMLLESKSGSLKATGVLALQLCKVLKDAKVKGAFLAPPDFERKRLASSFVLRDYRDVIKQSAPDSAAGKLVSGTVTSQVSAAGVLSAVTLMQYGAGALQTVAKLFKSDYAVAVADGKREAWFEYFMAASCPTRLPQANVEAVIRARGFDAEIDELNRLSEFANKATATRAQLKLKLDTASQVIAKKIAEGKPVLDGDKTERDDAQKAYDGTAFLDALVTRIKAVMDTVTTKTDTFLDALVWEALAKEYAEKPRLFVTFTTQDGQVTKTNWLFGKSVYGRSSGELIYRVGSADGKVSFAGYLVATNSDGKFDFSANQIPSASGAQYLNSEAEAGTTGTTGTTEKSGAGT